MNKFKVGDWVVIEDSIYLVHATNNGNHNISVDVINNLHNYKTFDVTLWQPQVGEWCWFKDEKNTIGSLTQLVGIEEDGTYYGYSSYGMPDKAPCVEPFIRELPTFLKDNS